LQWPLRPQFSSGFPVLRRHLYELKPFPRTVGLGFPPHCDYRRRLFEVFLQIQNSKFSINPNLCKVPCSVSLSDCGQNRLTLSNALEHRNHRSHLSLCKLSLRQIIALVNYLRPMKDRNSEGSIPCKPPSFLGIFNRFSLYILLLFYSKKEK
jgi:hypothetical protein